MRKLTTRGIVTAEAIGNREEFDTNGALSARKVSGLGPWDSGQLSGVDLACFTQDRADIAYVVRSYSTPIAWVMSTGRVHKVAQKFSVTTSKHQGNLYKLSND